MKFFIKLILTSLLLLPFFTMAWSIGDPIVPCGTSKTGPCTFCHFVVLVDNIVQFLLKVLIFPIAVVALLWAGFLFITAGGNPSQLEQGKAIFRYAILGIIIAFAAWVIVHLVLAELINTKFILEGKWFGFPTCDAVGGIVLTNEILPTTFPDQSSSAATSNANGTVKFSDSASLPLETFKNCFSTKLPAARVTSITDNNIAIVGKCNPTDHSGNQVFGNASACQHTEYSCHYGGRNENCAKQGSYAIDIGKTSISGVAISFKQVREAAVACETVTGANVTPNNPIAKCLDEGDHYHVSIGDVGNCDCDRQVSYCR